MNRARRKPHSLLLKGSKCIDTASVTSSNSVPSKQDKINKSRIPRIPVEVPTELTPSEYEELALYERERFESELEWMDKIKLLRRREGLTHREPMDFLMGGQKVMLFERMDILGELARLKSLSLPAKAKELYVGKGFKLPATHTLNNPPRGRRKHSTSSTGTGLQKHKGHSESGSFRGAPSVAHSAPEVWGNSDSDTDREKGKKRPRSEILQVPEETEEEETLPTNILQITEIDTIFAWRNPHELRAMYRELKLRVDGEIEFTHLEEKLPDDLASSEKQFIKQLYDSRDSATEFGEDEFMCIRLVSEKVLELENEPKSCFDKIDFQLLPMALTQYAELYQTEDRENTGRISVTSIRNILSNTVSPALKSGDGSFQRIFNNLSRTDVKEVTKVDYISWIPYFSSLEPE